MNQCCGGAVTLVTEIFDESALANIEPGPAFARPVEDGSTEMPSVLARMIARSQAMKTPLATDLMQGWLVEPLWQLNSHVVIYGAGHVGRALAGVMAPMPAFQITLVDARRDMLDMPPAGVLTSDYPVEMLETAPDDAIHLVMTHAHDLDLGLCHAILGRTFGSAGLIGSRTKWVRFRKRLIALGHPETLVDRIQCPIGDPSLGKHPQEIAVGVAADLIRMTTQNANRQEAC
jgi:xanthine dehydrogenase accessory factor